MKCKYCENPAVLHTTDIVAGAPRDIHLCREHAKVHLGDYVPAAAAKDAMRDLRRLLEEEDEYVRRIAAEALTKIEGETEE